MKMKTSKYLYISLLMLQILFLKQLQIKSQTSNVIADVLEFIRRGQADSNIESKDSKITLLKEYDFIIVGAGTAGCALAARLSENPNWKVLLLEAGGPETLIMDVPILAHFLQLGEMNWKYKTEPSKSSCLSMDHKRCNWPRGKVMGGSSVLNYMIYTRGNPKDYDRWAELGNKGWSYADLKPYFQKYEGSSISNAEPDYVGRNGPVKISYVNYRSKAAKAFVNAAMQDGLKYLDYNGKKQMGVSFLQTTTFQGIRWSSNRAYLYPLKGKRDNLHIKKYAHVTKVLINPVKKIAEGVLFSSRGQSFKVLAKLEVILSAGTINSPQILMLSGVGPAKHLRQFGIKPIADLAVGYNLQDHIAPGLSFTSNASSLQTSDFFEPKNINSYLHGKGIFGSTGACETIAFWDLNSKNGDNWPDIEMFLVGGLMNANPAVFRAFGLSRETFDAVNGESKKRFSNGFMIFPMTLRPKSRGRIILKSKDPFQHPLIYSGYLKHPYDVDMAVKGLIKTVSLLNKTAFQEINAKLIEKPLPGCANFVLYKKEYWECYARHMTLTIYHYVGTAKMGPKTDSSAVVDARLKVHGIKNLRVVDGSIMPEIISGHPNGPIFMIAEKAADMIKEDYHFI